MAWIREGECNRCGDCCRPAETSRDDLGPGFTTTHCPLFKWLEAGVGCCTNRSHQLYLAGCNVWPQHPNQIADKPRCSYSFRWAD